MAGSTVAITGAKDYVATEIVAQLLEKGYTVHATVRSLKEEAKYAHLKALKGGHLRLFEADLLVPGSYDVAFKGVDGVFHVATALGMGAKDPQKEVVDPAVLGTLNVLKSVEKNGVKTFVFTSSGIAVHSASAQKDVLYTEADWNPISDIKDGAYALAKTLAERELWKWAEEHKSVRVSAINLGFVQGPIRSARQVEGSSVGLLTDFFVGKGFLVNFAPGGYVFPTVHVEDSARAHIAAFEHPAASGRFIVCAPTGVALADLEKIAGTVYPSLKAAVPLPSLSGPRSYWSSRRAEEILGIKLQSSEKSIADAVRSLGFFGAFKPAA